MDYSKSKTYSRIMWIIYIIIAISAITFISKQESKLKTPIIEDVGQSSTVTDSTVTNEEVKEDIIEIYIPNSNNEIEENKNDIESSNTDSSKDIKAISNDKQ